MKQVYCAVWLVLMQQSKSLAHSLRLTPRQLLLEEPLNRIPNMMTIRCLLCGPTGCIKCDSRASSLQEQQIGRHPASYSYVAKCVLQHRAGFRATIWPNRLHSISTADNGAFIMWDNGVMEEFAGTLLAGPMLAYAYQNDIWQLVTSLSQMWTLLFW